METAISAQKPKKDEQKIIPCYCEVHNNITNHVVVFKSTDERLHQVVYTKQCCDCKTIAGLTGKGDIGNKISLISSQDFAYMWNTVWD